MAKSQEFAKGKNAIQFTSQIEVIDTPHNVRNLGELGELEASIEKQVRFGRQEIPKRK